VQWLAAHNDGNAGPGRTDTVATIPAVGILNDCRPVHYSPATIPYSLSAIVARTGNHRERIVHDRPPLAPQHGCATDSALRRKSRYRCSHEILDLVPRCTIFFPPAATPACGGNGPPQAGFSLQPAAGNDQASPPCGGESVKLGVRKRRPVPCRLMSGGNLRTHARDRHCRIRPHQPAARPPINGRFAAPPPILRGSRLRLAPHVACGGGGLQHLLADTRRRESRGRTFVCMSPPHSRSTDTSAAGSIPRWPRCNFELPFHHAAGHCDGAIRYFAGGCGREVDAARRGLAGQSFSPRCRTFLVRSTPWSRCGRADLCGQGLLGSGVCSAAPSHLNCCAVRLASQLRPRP